MSFPWYRIPYAILSWSVFIPVKLVLAVIGAVFAVPLSLVSDGAACTPKIWRTWARIKFRNWIDVDGKRVDVSGWSRWEKYKWFALRNPVVGLEDLTKEPESYEEYGNNDKELEEAGFKWRYRHSKWMDSFRITWGDARPSKGKHEFYIGFKIGSPQAGAKFTLQLR